MLAFICGLRYSRHGLCNLNQDMVYSRIKETFLFLLISFSSEGKRNSPTFLWRWRFPKLSIASKVLSPFFPSSNELWENPELLHSLPFFSLSVNLLLRSFLEKFCLGKKTEFAFFWEFAQLYFIWGLLFFSKQFFFLTCQKFCCFFRGKPALLLFDTSSRLW